MNLFRGRTPAGRPRQRVFGGQVAGQALVAAGRTVEDGPSRTRCTRTSCARATRRSRSSTRSTASATARASRTRRVVAIQHGEAIFHLSASFQRRRGRARAPDRRCRAAPEPESLPTFASGSSRTLERDMHPELAASGCSASGRSTCATSSRARLSHPETRPPHQQVWMRADGTLPDDPLLLHQCVVAYASDMTLLDTATAAARRSRGSIRHVQMASLDHAMWFHRPFRADEWLLYTQESPTAPARAASRGPDLHARRRTRRRRSRRKG